MTNFLFLLKKNLFEITSNKEAIYTNTQHARKLRDNIYNTNHTNANTQHVNKQVLHIRKLRDNVCNVFLDSKCMW
jgi:hypothetical protein